MSLELGFDRNSICIAQGLLIWSADMSIHTNCSCLAALPIFQGPFILCASQRFINLLPGIGQTNSMEKPVNLMITVDNIKIIIITIFFIFRVGVIK